MKSKIDQKKIVFCIWYIFWYSCLAFFILSSFPKLWGGSERVIRGLKHTTTATVDSVFINHTDRGITPQITFYYHFLSNKERDTVINSHTTVKHHSIFSYTADKLKQRYQTGSQIPVYYKIKKSGKYVSSIYPQNQIFHLDSFLLANAAQCLLLLFPLCFLVYIVIYRKRFLAFVKLSLFTSVCIFLLLCFVYAASPKLQRNIFEQTHPQFEKVETEISDWTVKRKMKRGRGSTGYHYITAKFNYSYNGKRYQSIIVPVKVYSVIAREKIAEKELRRLQKDHNNIAYIDKQNPEYAVLFASNRTVFIFSTFVVDFFGVLAMLLIFGILVSLFIASLNKKKTPKPLKPKNKFTLAQFLKIMTIVMLIIFVFLVTALFITALFK